MLCRFASPLRSGVAPWKAGRLPTPRSTNETAACAGVPRRLEAATAWSNLIRWSSADLAVATCTGALVKIVDGRLACNVSLWLGAPNLTVLGTK